MFYLTTHSTHFIYGYMVKDHSDSERGNPLPQHELLFPISSKGSFICIIPTHRITHTTAFVTPVVEHWLEREVAQWVHLMKDRSDNDGTVTMSERFYHGVTSCSCSSKNIMFLFKMSVSVFLVGFNCLIAYSNSNFLLL